MIIEVGNIVRDKLAVLSFIDKLTGVVKVITMTDVDSDNKPVKKTFPVSCDTSFTECVNDQKYKDFMPNSSLGCMVYLEDQGLRPEGTNGSKEKWKATYKLIGWINSAKLGYSDCSITGQIVATIMKKFPITAFNQGIYHTIMIKVASQDPKTGANPFVRYSYDEDKTQYLMFPYDYFSLNVEVSFEINKKCISDFVALPGIECP
ncbi:MAG: hypothetical protein M3R27_05865 [Bacteroidota bacterium]|nr:hypothetical protein [Bacteroidota bacterium]